MGASRFSWGPVTFQIYWPPGPVAPVLRAVQHPLYETFSIIVMNIPLFPRIGIDITLSIIVMNIPLFPRIGIDVTLSIIVMNIPLFPRIGVLLV